MLFFVETFTPKAMQSCICVCSKAEVDNFLWFKTNLVYTGQYMYHKAKSKLLNSTLHKFSYLFNFTFGKKMGFKNNFSHFVNLINFLEKGLVKLL